KFVRGRRPAGPISFVSCEGDVPPIPEIFHGDDSSRCGRKAHGYKGAFRDHGRVRGDTVLENPAEAESQLRALSVLGIDLNAITDKLQIDGVASFASAYDRVLDAIGKKLQHRPR